MAWKPSYGDVEVAGFFCLHILWNSLFSLSFEHHRTYYRLLERSWREESNGVKGEANASINGEHVKLVLPPLVFTWIWVLLCRIVYICIEAVEGVSFM